MATDPTGYISIPPELTRGQSWKQPCRVATTANITIATALNAGDTIDGVTLAAGDRVLVKDQSTGSQNGIYVAGASPARAFDMDQDLTTAVPAEEVLGAVVLVLAGTTNGGTLWRCTNTATPTIGTTALTFAEVGTTIPAGTYVLTTEGGQETVKAHGAMGSTEPLDPTDGNIHTGTLDADCTVTIAAPTGSGGSSIEFWVTQDGTGGWVPTIAATGGTFQWDGATPTLPTTAGVTYRLILERVPGTTNDWIGNLIGAASTVEALDDLTDVNAPAPSDGDVLTWDSTPGEWVAATPAGGGALDDLSDAAITAPAADEQLQYVGGVWVNNARRWEPVTTNPGTGPELVWDGDDIVMTWRAY